MRQNAASSSDGRGVVFCVPSLSRTVGIEFMASMLGTVALLSSKGIPVSFLALGGDPYLAKVRSRLASDFLRTDPTVFGSLFFLDDDIGWPAEAVLRLLESPLDVVAGVYPEKNDQTAFPIELELDIDHFVRNGDGLLKALHVPTGFLRIKRHVLEKMRDVSGTFVDKSQEFGPVLCWDIFQMGYIENPEQPGTGAWWGEDYLWSARWRGMGGEIWVDPNIEFTHSGRKTWRASIASSIAATEARIAEDVIRLSPKEPYIVAAADISFDQDAAE